MAGDVLGGLVGFVAVTLITPGPNNVMLMASGLNYGFSRTLPHLAGVALGFAFMVLLVGCGLGGVFAAWPWVYAVIKWAGVAYLVYMALGIAAASPEPLDGSGEGAGRPLTFIEAAAFQWVNPKAWVMAVGAMATYSAVAPFPYNVGIFVGLFGVLGLVSAGVWVAFGLSLRRVLTSSRAIRAFNLAMAGALLASLVPVLREALP
jgi:threonine/homoserine/homoserine lactone efflux protein